MYCKSIVSALMCSAALLFGAHAAQAEPAACKGMEQASCTQSGSCRWVDTYKRSDGRETKGYCRKLPKKNVKEASSRQEGEDSQSKKS